MIREVITSKCTHTRSVLDGIAVETALILVSSDSFVINSHVWGRSVSCNAVGSGSRCCERIVVIVMLKTWIFAPAPAAPAIVVTVIIVCAFSAFFGWKRPTDTCIHGC